MQTEDKHRLFRIVLEELSRHAVRRARKRVGDAIFAAHNGRPDGFLVTTDNMWLFRQYRNAVSPDPQHMIDAAFDYSATEEDKDAVPPM